MFFKTLIVSCWYYFNRACELLMPFGDLLIRYWVAKVFFVSGLIKYQSWDTTLMLFEFEYNVPFFSSETAAYLATAIELIIPVLLILGLAGRLPALFLFIFNIMIVISYPFLRSQEGYVGLKDHVYWGLLLLIILLHGPGKLSVDCFIQWIYDRYAKKKSLDPST